MSCVFHSESCEFLFASETLAEEVSGLPFRPLWFLRNVISNKKVDLHKLYRRIKVHRLIHIVRRGVIPVSNPFFIEFLSVDLWIFSLLAFRDKD